MKEAFDTEGWDASAKRKHLREKDVEGPSKAKARRAGWLVRKYSSPSNSAVPDDIFIRGGRVFFVEFKAPGKKPTELQEEEIKKMREHGATVYVVDSISQFEGILADETKRADAGEWLL